MAQAESAVRLARPQIVLRREWMTSLEPLNAVPEAPPHD
jgi:hypothetical protein